MVHAKSYLVVVQIHKEKKNVGIIDLKADEQLFQLL